MTIQYTKSAFIKENKTIEIENPKNVFLKGKNPYDNLDTYFGIWINKGNIVIVSIISYRVISYKRYLGTNLHTEQDIREYLENNNTVLPISKEKFKEQLDYIKDIFEF